jgi:hypothetical protein
MSGIGTGEKSRLSHPLCVACLQPPYSSQDFSSFSRTSCAKWPNLNIASKVSVSEDVGETLKGKSFDPASWMSRGFKRKNRYSLQRIGFYNSIETKP